MIKRWIITGDTHGRVCDRLFQITYDFNVTSPEETAVIILGDAGINYYQNKTDLRNKQRISEYGIRVYCVRGNHEVRPENIPGMNTVHDPDVGGVVYIEEAFPLIRYFVDGGEYMIGDKSVLVIGGAYSVDKYYRLAKACGGFSGWFEDEQLSEIEMSAVSEKVRGKKYDVVLTHTAPLDWEPRDLFLTCIDQSTVDKTMEQWLNELKDIFSWNLWCFGHYHASRTEAPRVEQFFERAEELDTLISKWGESNEKLDEAVIV